MYITIYLTILHHIFVIHSVKISLYTDTTLLSKIILGFKNINHLLYANDTQVYLSITPENANSVIP